MKNKSLFQKIKSDLQDFSNREDIVEANESIANYPLDLIQDLEWLFLDVWWILKEMLFIPFVILLICGMYILTVSITITNHFFNKE